MKFAAVKVSEEIAAGAPETLLQVVAATNHQIDILGWSVSFAGVTVTDEPIEVQLIRQSTAGTSSSLGLVKWEDSDSDTIDATALHDFTVEPTLGDLLTSVLVHPQGGYEIWYPAGAEPKIGGGDRMGIKVIAPAGVNPAATSQMVCRE